MPNKNTEYRKEYSKKWRLENPEYNKNYYASSPDIRAKKASSAVKQHLKTKYGITVEDYNTMFLKQNGCCAICETHNSKLSKSLAVDHCHTTGEIRGLLCQNCNTALGKFKDNITLLQNSVNYLQNGKLRTN